MGKASHTSRLWDSTRVFRPLESCSSVCSLLKYLHCTPTSVCGSFLLLFLLLLTLFLPLLVMEARTSLQPGRCSITAPPPVLLYHFISLTIALGQHSGCPSLPAQVVCPDVTQCHGLRASLGHHCPEMGLSYLHPVHAVGTSTTGQRAFQLPHEGTSHQKRHTLLGVQPHSSPLWFDSGNLGVVGFPSRQDPGML